MSLHQKLLGEGLEGDNFGPHDKALSEFVAPPDEARPWVYWYFMDGHLTREGMAADLEAMKKAGPGGGIFIEAGIGIEPGSVEFMSEPWQELLGLAFSQADRLGLQLSLVSRATSMRRDSFAATTAAMEPATSTSWPMAKRNREPRFAGFA